MRLLQTEQRILFISMLTIASCHILCPAPWKESSTSGTCIQVFANSKTWDAARAACKLLGADLVKIRDRQMNELVYEKIKETSARYFWIGLCARNGKFYWLDDTNEATFSLFTSAQPAVYNQHKTCAEMRIGRSSWYVYDKDFTQGYICEKLA
ncbi:hypothetical protein EGW08_023576, partial [Elysia chlorotica]